MSAGQELSAQTTGHSIEEYRLEKDAITQKKGERWIRHKVKSYLKNEMKSTIYIYIYIYILTKNLPCGWGLSLALKGLQPLKKAKKSMFYHILLFDQI